MRPIPAAAVAVVLAASLPPGASRAQQPADPVRVPVPAPAAASDRDPGFVTVVLQPPRGVEPERFGAAVAEALPRELTDPELNFMRDPAAAMRAPYRLVMVFHGSTDPPQTAICAAEREAADAVPRPPAPGDDPVAPTSVTAAFCREADELSRAHARISGGLDPGQVAFRFLVADVAKQLFPLGFAELPGRGPAGQAAPAAR
jgi:hypothetical protein